MSKNKNATPDSKELDKILSNWELTRMMEKNFDDETVEEGMKELKEKILKKFTLKSSEAEIVKPEKPKAIPSPNAGKFELAAIKYDHSNIQYFKDCDDCYRLAATNGTDWITKLAKAQVILNELNQLERIIPLAHDPLEKEIGHPGYSYEYGNIPGQGCAYLEYYPEDITAEGAWSQSLLVAYKDGNFKLEIGWEERPHSRFRYSQSTSLKDVNLHTLEEIDFEKLRRIVVDINKVGFTEYFNERYEESYD